jgi:Viral BACON domain
MITCKHCKANLPDNTRFCGRCGHFFDEGPMIPASSTPHEIADAPTKHLSVNEDYATLLETQVIADPPTMPLPSNGHQDQLQQDIQPTYVSQQIETRSEEMDNVPADIALGAIHLPSSQSMVEAPSIQHEDVGPGQHGAHHQPQVEHGAHHQPQVEHGVHHQPQVEHGVHHQPQAVHGAHHQPQVEHGAHHQPQVEHGVHHQPQAAHSAAQHGKHLQGLKGCRPSCLTVTISTAAVVTFVAASLFVLFFYILPGAAAPTLSIPTSVDPGEIIKVQGSNFSPGLHVLITLDIQQKVREDKATSLSQADLLGAVHSTTPLLAQQGTPLTVKNDGTFTTTLQADPSWHVGSQHTIYISRQDGSLIVKKQFTVKVSAPALMLCSVSASSASITLGPVIAGQNASISTSFKLCSQGSGQVAWNSSWNTKQAPWLTLARSGYVQAPQSQTIQFSTSAASLKAGTYTTIVTFSSLHSSSKINLKVILIVQDQNAQTCIKPASTNLSLTGVPGQATPVQQSVAINNCGETGNWSAVITTNDGASWLSVNPDHGTLQKGASQNITVTATTTNLVAGTYTGHIAFGAGSNASHIDITLVVTTTPQMKPCVIVNTNRLNFAANARGSNPAAQGVTISNGCGTGSWSATIDQSWLGLSATSGNINANGSINISVYAAIANLAAGTYTGHVTFYPGTASVTVTLNVQPVPCISVLRSAPDPAPVMEGSTSANLTETGYISNGCDAGSWTAKSDVPWITVNTASGSLAAGQTGAVSISINETAVGTGSFSGHITFSPGSGSSVMTINLTVYRKLCLTATPASLSFPTATGAPSQQIIVTTACNAGTVSISNVATDNGGNWLSAQGGGSLVAGSRLAITVTAGYISISGTYTGHVSITITSSDGGTFTIQVNVTNNVVIIT